MSVYKESFFGECINCLKRIHKAKEGVYCQNCGSEYHLICFNSLKYFGGKCGHCPNREIVSFPKNFSELLRDLPKVPFGDSEKR